MRNAARGGQAHPKRWQGAARRINRRHMNELGINGMSSSKFDIIVYGATGFTGQLVAEYLASDYRGENLKWAMAGRSQKKLAAVRDAIGAPADTPLIAADSKKPTTKHTKNNQTRLVLTTGGPYQH